MNFGGRSSSTFTVSPKKRTRIRKWDREFESGLLHLRVCKPEVPSGSEEERRVAAGLPTIMRSKSGAAAVKVHECWWACAGNGLFT
jgi:hypothetical protein